MLCGGVVFAFDWSERDLAPAAGRWNFQAVDQLKVRRTRHVVAVRMFDELLLPVVIHGECERGGDMPGRKDDQVHRVMRSWHMHRPPVLVASNSKVGGTLCDSTPLLMGGTACPVACSAAGPPRRQGCRRPCSPLRAPVKRRVPMVGHLPRQFGSASLQVLGPTAKQSHSTVAVQQVREGWDTTNQARKGQVPRRREEDLKTKTITGHYGVGSAQSLRATSRAAYVTMF